MRIRLLTVIWGSSFTDIFLRITVRSLLAEGNIAALAARHQVGYTIHTTAKDAAAMRASAVFRRIEALVPVEFAVFDDGDIDPKNPSSHWILWHRGAAAAKQSRELLFFIIPDMLYATGTLLQWAAFFERGFRAVCVAGPQVVLDTTLSEVEGRFPPSSPDPIALDVRAIHRVLLRHLHPLMISMFRDSPRWPRHPDTLVAAVPGQGLAMRVLASQPFCIDLNHFNVNHAFCPVDHLEDIAYDQPRTVCLEPILKFVDFHYRPGRLDGCRLSNMGSWIDYYFGPSDVLWASQNARVLWSNDVDETAFRRAEVELGFLVCQMRLTRTIYRVLQIFGQHGCNAAARMAAAAHFAGRLRRRWQVKGPVTVFVPQDSAFAFLAPGEQQALACPGNEKLLVNAVLAHVFPGTFALKAGDRLDSTPDGGESLTPARGTRLRVLRSGAGASATVTAGPFEVDDCTIYVIDRPLSRRPLRAARWPRTTLPNRWLPHPDRHLPSSVAEHAGSPASPVVPLPPMAAANSVAPDAASRPANWYALKVLSRRILRRGYRLASSVPGLRRPAAIALSLYERRRERQHETAPGRVASAAQRVARRLRPIAGSGRRIASGLSRRGRLVGHALRPGLLKRSAGAAVPPELSHSASKYSDRPLSAQILDTAREDILVDSLRLLQAVRILLNLRQLFRFYADKMKELGSEFPPLQLVENCIAACRLSEDRYIGELQKLVREAPDFAEAWLELGYAHLDRGNGERAVHCFDCSIAGRSLTRPATGRMACHDLAALAKAEILGSQGLPDEAAAIYRRALPVGSPATMKRLAYARLLRGLGEFEDALSQWAAAMNTDVTSMAMPPMPRDFAVLAEKLRDRFAAERREEANHSGRPDSIVTSGLAAATS